MKIKGILLTLFLSFAGISLVGCGLFDAIKEVSAAAAKQTAEKAKETAGEAKAAAEKEIADNSGADHSVCNEVIGEVPTIVDEADAAIAAAKAAETGTADDVTTANDQANAVKEKADAAKTKAEGCAKEAEAAGPETKKAVLVYYHAGTSEKDSSTQCPDNVTAFIPTGEDSCAKGSGDCVAKAAEWKTAQEGAGFTCTEEEKERTSRFAVCPPVKETIYTCTKQ